MDSFEKLYYETAILLYTERIRHNVNIVDSIKALREFTIKLDHLANGYINTKYEKFSPREVEVLALVKEGLTNQEIADRLYITINTVKKHVSRLMDKAYCKNRTELISKGY